MNRRLHARRIYARRADDRSMIQTVLDEIARRVAPRLFAPDPVRCTAHAELEPERIECKVCEGSGQIPVGEYRARTCEQPDGGDFPGLEICESCDGTGAVDPDFAEVLAAADRADAEQGART